MGGKAFQGLSRMTKAGYMFATNVVAEHMNLIGLHNHYFPKTFRKESYGDVDVFLNSGDKTLFEQDTGLLNIIDKRTNGDSVHYLCEVKLDLDTSFKFQVDLNYCYNPSFQASYFSYNGLCVFLSLTAKSLGLKFNNKGLFIEKPYINKNGCNGEPIKILISSSFDHCLKMLGFSPIEFSNITNFEEAVAFLKKSKYFDENKILTTKIKQSFDLLDYFNENHHKINPEFKNEYKYSDLDFSYINQRVRSEYKFRRKVEHDEARFKFKRIHNLSKYLLITYRIKCELTNEDIGNVICLSKQRYYMNKLKYESRAALNCLISCVITEYCAANKSYS